MAKEVWYSIADVPDKNRYRLALVGDVDISRPIEQEDVAEQCAQHYWGYHDGYDLEWPLYFKLFADKEGDLLATVNVEIEMSPKFRGALLKNKPCN